MNASEKHVINIISLVVPNQSPTSSAIIYSIVFRHLVVGSHDILVRVLIKI